jgi:hypothetical protein
MNMVFAIFALLIGLLVVGYLGSVSEDAVAGRWAVIVLYWTPSIIAVFRAHKGWRSILLWNFFGILIVTWLAAFRASVGDKDNEKVIS